MPNVTRTKPEPDSLRLYLLGSFRLEQGGHPVRLSTRKVESLLAYLALHPQVHSRESLAGLFWGDSSDEAARRSLRVALTVLRKQLGESAFLAARESLGLNPESLLWVDALDFKAQAEKLLAQNSPDLAALQVDLYQGPLLKDFFDDWVTPVRETYAALYGQALLHLIGQARSQSDYQRAITLARRLLINDPANELAHQHLMVCYAASGDRAAALKQYEECVRSLAEELAVGPASETIALYEQLQESVLATTISAQTNLPVPLTSFVGRSKELEFIQQRFLPDWPAHLLTLVGPGGTGKTRLAIRAASDLVSQFKGGVWWIELAALTEPSLVVESVAAALGLAESARHSWTEQLVTRLRNVATVLVLDNCEQVLTACAELATVLLQQCPGLHILATSREPLGVTGETTLPVKPLPIPTDQSDPLAFESVRLFFDRARSVNAAFTLTADNAPLIIQVCRRLDGIPLAIELAAAQLNQFSIEDIAARLDDRFRLLVGHQLTSLPRQQTLRALIDWSHDLLHLPERALFRRLAVFAGGWTLEAAIVVAGGYSWAQARETDSLPGDGLAPLTVSPRTLVRDLLDHLIEKSLVTVQLQGGERRYSFLENIHLYGKEKLIDANELTAMQMRHLDFFLQLAEAARPHLRGSEQLRWLKQLETEHDNIRAALTLVSATDETTALKGLRLATALLWFFHIRGHRAEGHQWMTRLLAAVPLKADSTATEIKVHAQALYVTGRLTDEEQQRALFVECLALSRKIKDVAGTGLALASLAEYDHFTNQFESANAYAREALPLLRTANDPFELAQFLNNVVGPLAFAAGNYVEARAAQQEAAALRESLGDKDGLAWSLYQLGQVATAQGNFAQAWQYYEQSLPLWRAVENNWLLERTHNRLGFLALRQGQLETAQEWFGTSLRTALAQGNSLGCALALNGMAGIKMAQNKIEEAIRLLAALQDSFADPEARWATDDFEAYQQQKDYAAKSLTEAELAAIWADGKQQRMLDLANELVRSL